jgi:LuxR family transcriptional regulator, maltose regulon positive regulatory protein
LPIVESKLYPQVRHRGGIPRTELLDRLKASSASPVVAVVAPPGYGKTTLLAQWSERDRRPFAWLSIDQNDNDPAVLLTHLAAALDRVEPLDSAVFGALASPGGSSTETAVLRLGSFLSATAAPVVVALDDAHLLQNWECLDAIATLIERLAPGSQFAIAGRADPPPPLASLRAEDRVVSFGREDLAMDREEAVMLLRDAGVDLSGPEIDDLLRRTEGWPVALYLAALSVKAGGPERVAR